MKEDKTYATAAPNIPFSACGINFELNEVLNFYQLIPKSHRLNV